MHGRRPKPLIFLMKVATYTIAVSLIICLLSKKLAYLQFPIPCSFFVEVVNDIFIMPKSIKF